MTRIDTVDQLDALPIGSIVKTVEGWAARRMDTSYAQCWDVPETFRRGSYPATRLIEHGPLTLLFVPGRDLVQEAQADAWDEGFRAGLVDNPYRNEAP